MHTFIIEGLSLAKGDSPVFRIEVKKRKIGKQSTYCVHSLCKSLVRLRFTL
jgi:hypothetical protein